MALRRPGRVSRREALKLLGLGTAGSLAGAALPLPRLLPARRESRRDVVVVGAGLAGLTAARHLVRSGKTVVLLEARDRVGGRVKAGRIAGHTVDLGGMWVGPSQTHLLALLRQYGVRTTPQYLTGRCITEIRGKRYIGDGEDVPLGGTDDAEMRRLSGRLEVLSAQVPVESPWAAPRAQDWDRLTLDEWIRLETKNPVVRSMMEMVCRGLFSAEPYELSLLFFLFCLRSGNGLEELWGMKAGAQALHVPGGMHRLASRMASELGGALVLGSPVAAISQDEAGVTVTTARGSWRGALAIVSIPLPLSARISYHPALPAQRDLLAQRSPMASVIKCWIAYREPFWRRRGWNALVSSDEPPIEEFVDASPPDGSVGLIAGFIGSRSALGWTAQPLEERKRRIAARISLLLGPEGADPIDYVENDWLADPWTRGCYGATMGPGVLTALGPYLRASFGRIHWAGSETSSVWSGYIEGAIRSGERAASAVLARPQSPLMDRERS